MAAAKTVKVTEEMLAKFPDWATAGIKVGDDIKEKDLKAAEKALADASKVDDVLNPDGSVTHVVTEEDHTAGKFTTEEVGKAVTYTPEAPVKPATKATGKGPVAVVTENGYFIRTYEDKAVAEAFCAKEGGRSTVAVSDIAELVVEYDVKQSNGSMKHEVKHFDVEDAENALALKAEYQGVCKYVLA